MKPHIYLWYGRWYWTRYGKVLWEGASPIRLYMSYYEADDFTKRKNHKIGLLP